MTNTLLVGGAEKQAFMLLKKLRVKLDTYLVVYYGEQVDKEYLMYIDQYRDHIILLKGNHISKIIELFLLFRKKSVKVCISYLATTNILNALLGRLAFIPVRIGGIRSSMIFGYKKWIQRFLHNNLLTATVFNNNAAYKELVKYGFDQKKAFLIYNGIIIPEQFERIEPDQNKINVLTVSRFVTEKDLVTSLLAVSKTLKLGTEFIYTLVGYGPLQNTLEEIISKNNIGGYVKIVINPVDKDRLYHKSHIYLSTSIREGLSNSIMEAMAYQLPVIATDVGDNKQLILDNKTGYLVNIADINTIAGHLKSLVESKVKRQRMGEDGYIHLINNFSAEKMGIEYFNLISNYLNAK